MHPYLTVFSLKIPSYSLFALLGCIFSYILFILLIKKRREICLFHANILFLLSLLCGFLGSKLLYIIVEADYFISSGNFTEALTKGGFVFYGGLIFAMLFCRIYCKNNNIPAFSFFDAAAPSVCLGQAFGRIGCFFAGCCYGKETSSFLGVKFPYGGASGLSSVFPVQLFESAFLFILCAVLIFLFLKKYNKGVCSYAYLFSYGIWRFSIEFLRADDRGSVLFFSTSQIISLLIIAISLYTLCKTKSRRIV